MYLKIVLTLLLSSILISNARSQSPVFYEVVRDDSVMLFYDAFFNLTNSRCRTMTRYTRADTVAGHFIGNYVDVDNHDVVLSRGTHTKGMRNGYFEIFYKSGKLQSRGNYEMGRPVGQWEFFYENGLPERTLTVTDADILLMRFVSEKGDVTVANGNGKFDGFVGSNFTDDNLTRETGKIVNGKRHGKWSSMVPGLTMTLSTEEYAEGKFIKGVLPGSSAVATRTYTDRSRFGGFFLKNYLDAAGSFSYVPCPEVKEHSWPIIYKKEDSPQSNYKFDMNRFKSDLRVKIDRIIEEDFKQGRSNLYTQGDNYLTVKFSINEKGKAFGFKTITSWGYQLERTVESAIMSSTVFAPGSGPLYFHLKLSYPGGFTYAYSFQFSKDMSPH